MLNSMREVVSMRTTVTLDDALIEDAMRLTGSSEKSLVIRRGLEALIQQESARRLAQLGGSDPSANVAPRERQSR